MKKILLAILLALGITNSAHAITCQDALGIAFTPAQKTSLCGTFGSEIVTSLVPSANNAIDLGTAALAFRSGYFATGVVLTTTGATLSVQEATAASACMGSSTPNGTTPVTVTTSCAVNGSRVFLSRNAAVANVGVPTVTTSPNGTSFAYASTNAADNAASSVVWWIIKESS